MAGESDSEARDDLLEKSSQGEMRGTCGPPRNARWLLKKDIIYDILTLVDSSGCAVT